MDIRKFKKILGRYRKGKANETENALVEAWYMSYRASDKAGLSNKEADELGLSLQQSIKSAIAPRKVLSLPMVVRIAAALTLFVSAALLVWHFSADRYILVVNPDKAIKKIALPDGSAVWLNAASRLKIPKKFTGETRDVFLEEGEAFFEVKKDQQHPFVVHTKPLAIRVLGTSFNIKAYSDLHKISVAVVTGKVGVSHGARTLGTLIPGQELFFNIDNGDTHLKDIDPEQAQSWKKGITYLDQADFAELALTLKNIYGIEVRTDSKTISNYQFSLGLIHNLPVSQILELVNQIHHTNFKREGNDIIIY